MSQSYYEAFAKRMEMAGIRPHHKIAIGVSGGADSMALCILASLWKCSELGTDAKISDHINGLVGLVVDHGLRAGSGIEANHVQTWISSLGIQCDILQCEWPNGPPKQGHLQEAARNARYKMLKDKCKQYHIGVLLVAHHADDQAELLVLRLSRHSGVAGLAGMAFVCQVFSDYSGTCADRGILLVRPLLCFNKDDLYKICEEAGQKWIEDPTNQNTAFARNRIRKFLRNLQSCDFKNEVQALISGCRRLRTFLNIACDHLMKETVSVNEDYGYAVLDVQKLLVHTVNDLCLSRFLSLLLQFISQRYKPIRGRAIEMLIKYIRNYPCKSSLTIAGCYICPSPGSKGLKTLVCFSCDSPQSTSSRIFTFENLYSGEMQVVSEIDEIISASQEFSNSVWQFESDVPFLHVDKTETVLTEGKNLRLISESTLSRLLLLKDEMSKDLDNKHEDDKVEGNGWEKQITDKSVVEQEPLFFGQSCYFMNRFIVSWGRSNYSRGHEIRHIGAPDGTLLDQSHSCSWLHRKCSSCPIQINMATWLRHMKEADWTYLSHLVECRLTRKHVSLKETDEEIMTSITHSTDQEEQKTISCAKYVAGKAREALARLKTIPIPARRALPVLVNGQGTLLGIPSISFTCCPYISVFTAFNPKVPLGGGYSSWI